MGGGSRRRRLFVKLRVPITHEIVVAQCLPQGVKERWRERETANAPAAATSRNYEVAVGLAVSLLRGSVDK